MNRSKVNTKLTPRNFRKLVRPDKPLSVALLEAMEDEFDSIIKMGDFEQGGAYPIDGSEFD